MTKRSKQAEASVPPRTRITGKRPAATHVEYLAPASRARIHEHQPDGNLSKTGDSTKSFADADAANDIALTVLPTPAMRNHKPDHNDSRSSEAVAACIIDSNVADQPRVRISHKRPELPGDTRIDGRKRKHPG